MQERLPSYIAERRAERLAGYALIRKPGARDCLAAALLRCSDQGFHWLPDVVPAG